MGSVSENYASSNSHNWHPVEQGQIHLSNSTNKHKNNKHKNNKYKNNKHKKQQIEELTSHWTSENIDQELMLLSMNENVSFVLKSYKNSP